ncbi:bifunctional methyltransferase/pyrophosphohydrolase YabN [Oceanobacillus halotolerans]|uniref:nucleoside triphosphate pyrophosphohydrolase n=1 Tax=Oceanobacillus halotolerans TaxID=2663380 RepID=UPI0013DA46AD|nr:nucleoside triphosphate pyrophosphohydrolase [Oceanobacillus halotolerans]
MGKIDVIGLGAGDLNQLPVGIYKTLTETQADIYTRTIDHPVVKALQNEDVKFISFDGIYEAEDQFEKVYERIVDTLLDEAKKRSTSIIYTVPGHPMLAEKTVQLLLEQSEAEVSILGGQSYLDDLFTALQIDPIEGFQFVDGMEFDRANINYQQHLIFCQVYDQMIASNVKLALLEDLPPDYEITIVEAAGTRQEKIQTVSLADLDRSIALSNLTTVYVPPASKNLLNHTFTRLHEVIATLRSPDGCPWDRAQTHESLRPYAIEEVYELIEAINNEDDENLIEELGDVLLQVMLHSQIGEDDGYFTIDDVIHSITTKMIHRHPHVFQDVEVNSVDDVYKNWEELKKEEKGEQRQSILDGIPTSLPSLAKAYKLQKKAAKVGFDWKESDPIWEKLQEEIDEFQEAVHEKDQTETEKELGDVLFVIANIARYYKINPEIALEQTNQKFRSRFSYIEEQLQKEDKDIHHTSLEEMDYYWNQAKERE